MFLLGLAARFGLHFQPFWTPNLKDFGRAFWSEKEREGHFGSWLLLGLSWCHLGAILALSWAILGLSWAILGRLVAGLWPSWAVLGTILGQFRRSCGRLEAILG